MEVRRYLPGEEAAIWEVYYGSTRHVVAREYTSKQVQRWAPDTVDWQTWTIKLARTKPFVALIDGQIVGFAELDANGHIDCFYCHQDFQRQGVGTALLKGVEQEAVQLGLELLFAEVSTTGIKFFQAKGFKITQEKTNVVCDAPAKQFLVSKSLSLKDYMS